MKTSRWVFSTVVLLASSCGVQDTSNTQGLNLNSSPKAAAADTALNGTFLVRVPGQGQVKYNYSILQLSTNEVTFKTTVIPGSSTLSSVPTGDNLVLKAKQLSSFCLEGSYTEFEDAAQKNTVAIYTNPQKAKVIRYDGQTDIVEELQQPGSQSGNPDSDRGNDTKGQLGQENNPWLDGLRKDKSFMDECAWILDSRIAAECAYAAFDQDGKPVLDPNTGKQLQNGYAVSYPNGDPRNSEYERQQSEHMKQYHNQ